jgi:Zn-dependent metalloprotease
MLVNNDRWHEMGGVNNIANMMGLSTDHSFQLVNTHQGRVNDHVIYFRYQQYYKNIAVEGGGFTVAALAVPGTTSGPDDPCLQVQMFSPFVAADIHLSDQTTVNTANLENVVESHHGGGPGVDVSYVDSDLLYWPNLLNDCTYHLTWDVKYTVDGELKRAWVDVQDGTVLKVTDGLLNLLAPMVTPGYGALPGNLNDLDDSFDGSVTRLISEDSDTEVRVYDFRADSDWDYLDPDLSIWTDDLIPATSLSSWDGSVATPHIYQSHFATVECVDVFSSIGINFGVVRVGIAGSASALDFNDDGAFILLGRYEDGYGAATTALFDVVAHELAHCFMYRGLLESSNSANKSLHEGIADMFGTYIESLIQGNVDWVMGDDEPFLANVAGRDLSAPEFDCFDDVVDVLFPHPRSTPLSHWFYLASTGDAASGINALGMETVLGFVIDALESGTTLSDYQDLRDAVLGVVELQLGVCSDEYTSIARAWNAICVGYTPTCPYIVQGVTTVCEEDDNLLLCLQGGSTDAIYRWYVPGTANWTANGESGTNSFEGQCLDVDQFGDYPYYPQTFKVTVSSPTFGSDFNLSTIVRLLDCDNSSPTCHEYYNGLDPLMGSSGRQRESVKMDQL